MSPQTHSDNSGLETFGGRVRAVREARGLKLGITASKIALSRTSLGQWESGNVKNPDQEKVALFSKLTDVNLNWLMKGTGPAPDLRAQSAARRSKRGDADAPTPTRAISMEGDGIAEIAGSLPAHATRLDTTPKALWDVPNEVLELTFHATPGRSFIMRVNNRSGAEFGLQRDDYTLLDATRTMIDEPGLYLVADPEGLSARRAQVVETDGVLQVALLADDLTRPPQIVDGGGIKVLGRIMGVFRPL